MSGRFRVLALDGGGIRGAYAAAVLDSIENSTGNRVVDYFDLITGTSTGGIIAVALALRVPAHKILEFYKDRGPQIFPSKRWVDRFLGAVRRIGAAKHGTGPLRDALVEVLGNRTLGEASTRLAIPAYDVVSNAVHVFKTAHDVRFREDYRRSAVEVALATSAAPTYLARAVTNTGEQLVDGGIWANCPAMVGVAEALAMGHAISEISMLSIGTLAETRDFGRRARGGGILHYRLGILSLLMDAQARGALSQAQHLLRERLLRVDQAVAPGLYTLDDARALDDLIAHGRHDGRHRCDAVRSRFLDVPVEPFAPAHPPVRLP